MAQGGVGDAALDMGTGREGRIHQDDGRAERHGEVVVDVSGIVLTDGSVGEDPAQEGGAMIGKLVEDQARAGELGMDGEQAGAGGRFQHRVGGSQRSGAGGDMRDRQRCRQLLQGLALRRALRVGRQQRGKTLQHAKTRVRTARCRCQRRAPSPEREMARYRHPGRRLTSPETSRVPRQGSFIHINLIAAPSTPGAMPPLPVASRVRLDAGKSSSVYPGDGAPPRVPSSTFGPDESQGHCLSPLAFPRFSPQRTHASNYG